MKAATASIVIMTGAVGCFGAGFISCHYLSCGSTSSKIGMDLGSHACQYEHSSAQGRANPVVVGTAGKYGYSAREVARLSAKLQATPRNQVPLSAGALPLHASYNQDEAQWEMQQWEIREGQLAELETIIQSMEAAGLPEEEIEQLRAHREERAIAPTDEFQAWNLAPQERTSEELRADFAASLEQSDIPEAERSAMLELHSHQFGLSDESLNDFQPAGPPEY